MHDCVLKQRVEDNNNGRMEALIDDFHVIIIK